MSSKIQLSPNTKQEKEIFRRTEKEPFIIQSNKKVRVGRFHKEQATMSSCLFTLCLFFILFNKQLSALEDSDLLKSACLMDSYVCGFH